jgi:hypothetical protein
MNKTENNLQPGMLMKTPKPATDGIEMYDVVFGDLGEERLTTEELVDLSGKPYKWCCGQPHCRHFIRFTLDQLDAIPFLIVRHLEKIHQMTHEQIEDAQPALKKEIVHERWLESEPTPDTP